MGMLEGFAIGATAEYGKQRDDDRKEGREIEKEKRVESAVVRSDERRAKIATIAANRLAEVQATASGVDREFRTSERKEGEKFTASENVLTREQQSKVQESDQGHDINKMEIGQGYKVENLNLGFDQQTSERQGAEAHGTGMLNLGQEFQAAESSLDRTHTSTEKALDREFTAVQKLLDKDFTQSERQALQAHQIGIQQLSQDHKTSERISTQGYSTSERRSSEANDLAKMILGKEIDQQNMTLSYGQAVVDVSDPANPVVKYVRGDKPGTTGAHTQKSASAFFSAEAKAYYGKLDKSGVTSFGTSRQADLANRASSISMQLYNKFGGRVDPNTVFSMVFQHIATQAAILDPDAAFKRLTAYIEESQGFFSENFKGINENEQKNIDEMRTKAEADAETIRTDLTLPGGPTSTPATPDQTVPTLNSRKEVQNLPPGTDYIWGPTGKGFTTQPKREDGSSF